MARTGSATRSFGPVEYRIIAICKHEPTPEGRADTMHSETALIAIFCGIVFITGAASGALVLFAISLHRTRRASLFEADGQHRGGTHTAARRTRPTPT
jgi:hypothetical protein